MPYETTMALIKPGAVYEGYTNDIIATYLEASLSIVAIRCCLLSEKNAGTLYQEHQGTDYFANLVQKMCTYPVIVLVMQGDNAVQTVRSLHGPSAAAGLQPGTIRHTYQPTNTAGHTAVVHSADSPEAAQREIRLFFGRTY